MTTAADLLAELRGLGIELQAHGEGLHFRPRDRITPALLTRLRNHKTELLAVLQPQDVQAVSIDLPAEPPSEVHPLDAWLDQQDWSRWRYTNGRLTSPNAKPADEWDKLPNPGGPCPVCGSLDVMWGLWGERICQRCNGEKLERSLKLAERAERLRRRAPPKKPASPEPRRCEQSGVDDMLPIGSPRPSVAILDWARVCGGLRQLVAR